MSNAQNKRFSKALWRFSGMMASYLGERPDINRTSVSRMYSVNRWDFEVDLPLGKKAEDFYTYLDNAKIERIVNNCGPFERIVYFSGMIDGVLFKIEAGESRVRVEWNIYLSEPEPKAA